MRLRILSAVVLAPFALACLWYGELAWALLIVAAGAGLALEWLRLCGETLPSFASVAVLAAILAALFGAHDGQGGAALALLGLAALLVLGVTRRGRLALGLVYIGVAAVALLWLRDAEPGGRGNVLFLVLVVWGSDIGAYAVGRLVGGPRLAPAISPGKTWSGALGGLLAAAGVGWLAAAWLTGATGVAALPVAAGLSVAAQLGDLLESALKRGFGVKDSGRLIPGHGGLLDRLDGMLTAAPAAALLALWLGRGVVLWQ